MTAAPNGPRIRVLICEDSDDDALLIATHLRRGGLNVDYERAERAEHVAEALRERTPDLVISDYHMPGFGAERALELLRDSGYDLPFILVSGRIGEEEAATLMRSGAHDFVLKDRMTRLVPVIRRELYQAQQRRDRRALEQKLRQAERLDSLGRLAGGIAHDFNNLLAVILGRTDIALADMPEDDPHRESLTVIRELAERGAGLTRHLLVFSRQQPLHPETLSANDIVADTERVLRGAIGEDIEFTTRLAEGLWPVRIDRSELERLLLNLVANARRAMPHGGQLTIQTANVPGDGHDAMVRIVVADTGTGMSEEVLGRAFEPFFTTDAAAGTGLGLSTAYGVVNAAGGEIGLYSRPGGGTTVRIDLPAHLDPAEDLERPAPPARPGRGQQLLIVEDDDDVRDLVGLMVRRGGYHAVCLPGPAAALDVIRAREGQPFDALVTDMVMAGMTGIELARAARDHVPGLPVLIMSGYTAGTLPEGAALPEGVVLIRKPFTKDALLHAVSEVLDARA